MLGVWENCYCSVLVQLTVKMEDFVLSGAVKSSADAANRVNTQPGFSDSRGTDIICLYIAAVAAEDNTLRGCGEYVTRTEITKPNQRPYYFGG